jgi:thiamine-monophosphate kinase
MNEFELIRQYFTRPAPSAVLGVGDDAAILRPTPGQDLHVSVDMLVEGRHFFADVSPQALGHKTLAVNLSDMAAMGARPRWAFLALALPQTDESWVRDFSRGLFALADQYGVELVGGDTTRGSLTLSITIMGETPQGQALRRDAAQAGDDVWVSGELGLGAIAVALRSGKLTNAGLSEDVLAACQCKLDFPVPRLELGQALLGVAHAAADVSDGLLADLGHILQASGVAADIWADSLPSLPQLEMERWHWLEYLAAGGDDYELCFTAPPTARDAVLAAGKAAGCRVTRIGCIVAGDGANLLDKTGAAITLNKAGYDHFA